MHTFYMMCLCTNLPYRSLYLSANFHSLKKKTSNEMPPSLRSGGRYLGSDDIVQLVGPPNVVFLVYKTH